MRETRRGLRVCGAWRALLGLLALAHLPAAAQGISYEGQDDPLPKILAEVQRQTGYQFQSGVADQFEGAAGRITWKEKPLPAALLELSERFKITFYAADTTGFYVVSRPGRTEPEVEVGPYRLRVDRTDDPDEIGSLRLTLAFAAKDDLEADRIAGLAPDLEVVDNFGRPMVTPSVRTTRAPTGARQRLTEYWHRLTVSPKDRRAVRIRAIRGRLLLYREVTPLRFEFPLDGTAGAAQTVSKNGLDFHLERVAARGQVVSAVTRLEWAAGRNVVGRGIGRTPLPYLVDDAGRVYRDWRLRLSRDSGERESLRQSLLFEGVTGKPARLVYEVLLREHPEPGVPFALSHLPLRTDPQEAEERAGGAFYAAEGGALTLDVRDAAGRPVEGEVSLGLSRRTATGWSGWRWVEAPTDPQGRARVPHLQPGTYRVRRLFRLAPELPPAAPPAEPVEVTVTTGREAALPALRVPAPPEPANS